MKSDSCKHKNKEEKKDKFYFWVTRQSLHRFLYIYSLTVYEFIFFWLHSTLNVRSVTPPYISTWHESIYSDNRPTLLIGVGRIVNYSLFTE